MPGVPVRLDRAPFAGRLLLWGRAADGWWGLLEWSQTVRRDTRLDSMEFTAWVPASALTRPNWSSGAGGELTRITLGADRGDWPPPARASGHTGWFAGAWPGGPVRTPPGVEVVSGPAWRNRPDRPNRR